MYIRFSLFSIFLGFLPLILYLTVKNKLVPGMKLILPLLVLSFLSSSYEYIFTYLLNVDSSIWFKIYPLFELFVLMHYFYKLLKGRYIYMYYFFGLLYLACFCGIVCLGKIGSFMDGDSYLQAIESVFVITAILLWMKYAFINLEEDSLLKLPHFYFISGLLFYFSGTLFLYLLSNIILKNGDDYFVDFWMLNVCFNIFLKILLLGGIWKGRVQ